MTRVVDRRSAAPLAIALLALVAVAYFDLQTNLPLIDEYARRWTIQRVVDGRGLVLWGSSPNIPEMLLALPLALAHLEPRFWRLAGLPFLGAGGVFSGLIAARLGADRLWAAVSGALVVVSPMVLGLATGMMTETAFIGLMLASVYFSLRWVTEGRDSGWAIALAVLCTLQREQGLALAAVVPLGLFLTRAARPPRRADVVGVALLWALLLGAAAAVEGYRRLGPSTLGADTEKGQVVLLVAGFTALPLVAGFFLAPFLVALLRRPTSERLGAGVAELVPVALAVFGVALTLASGLLLAAPQLVGLSLPSAGLGVPVDGGKADLLPLVVQVAIELVTLATVATVMIWRRRMWRPAALGVEGAMLVALAGIQFAAIFVHGQVFSRYLVPVLVVLVPLVAARASAFSPRRWGAVVAVAGLAAGVALYAVGEQDFIAWEQARDGAAQMAYAQAAVDDVGAGFEETAVRIWIPAMDNPGAALPRRVRDHPRWILVTAAPDDPRPGVGYSSISPGKVVLQAQP